MNEGNNKEYVQERECTVILSPCSNIRSAPAGSSVNAQGLTIV